jgi:hypothetical protein
VSAEEQFDAHRAIDAAIEAAGASEPVPIGTVAPPLITIALVDSSKQPLSLRQGEFTFEDLVECFTTFEVGDKDGESLIPAIFKVCPPVCANRRGKVNCGGGKRHRLSDNVIAMTGFCVDLDTLKPGELQAHLERFKSAALAHIWWETFSHTPAAPRARVFFPFTDPLPIERAHQWSKGAWGQLAAHLGLDGIAAADEACKDPARLYYTPRHPAGATRAAGYHAAQALDWTKVVVLPPAGVPVVPPPRPQIRPDIEVGELKKLLVGSTDPLVLKVLKGEAPTPPPQDRKPGQPSRYVAWRRVTSKVSLRLNGDEPLEAVLEVLQPSWLAEAKADPDNHTAWETVENLMLSAMDSAPEKKGEIQAERTRMEDLRTRALRKRRPLAEQPSEGEPETTVSDERAVVEVTHNRAVVNDQAESALAGHPAVFKRGGFLVRVVEESPPRTEALAPAVIDSMLTEVVHFTNDKGLQRGPPDHAVKYIHSRGGGDKTRAIDQLIEAPTMRPDGTFVTDAGYDSATRSFYIPTCEVPAVAAKPSHDDACSAVASLLEIVVDFPFETPADKSAWVAALLTQSVRTVIEGPTPLIFVGSATPATGKSKLIDAIATIYTGCGAPRQPFSADEAEQRKQITSTLMAGSPACFWDNVAGTFGGAAIDALLTSSTWRDRVLGGNRVVNLPQRTLFSASGNNVRLAGDVARRTLHVRMVSPVANPEQRSDFKHADLLGHVHENRGRFLATIQTIYRAYVVAGAPKQQVPAWGSFESWSRWVREPIVWLGLADPAARREEHAAMVDTNADALDQLVQGLRVLLAGRKLKGAEIHRELTRNSVKHAELIGLLTAQSKTRDTSAHLLGNLLTSFRERRTSAGLWIASERDSHTKTQRWFIGGAP